MPKMAAHIQIDPNTGIITVDGVDFPWYVARETIETTTDVWSIVRIPVICESLEVVPLKPNES